MIGFLIGAFAFILVIPAVRIVPQSEKHVVERLGRFRRVLDPGLRMMMPVLDSVEHRVSILDRQLPPIRLLATTKEKTLVHVESAVSYGITEPEKIIYRTHDIDGAIGAAVAVVVRAEIGGLELDTIQSDRASFNQSIQTTLSAIVNDWGVEVTSVDVATTQPPLGLEMERGVNENDLRAVVERGAGETGSGTIQ